MSAQEVGSDLPEVDAVRLLDADMSAQSRSVLDAVHRYEAADLLLRGRLATALGINTHDLAALRHIRRRLDDGVPVRVRDLEQWLDISNASASVMAKRLERAGLIEKQPNANDRRERSLGLTDHGRSRLNQLAGTSPQALDALLDTVTTRESRRIVHLLNAVTAVLEHTALPDPDPDPDNAAEPSERGLDVASRRPPA